METNNYDDEPFIEKSKHKGLKILLILLLIAGIAYGGYYYYVNYYNNPSKKVETVITSLEEKLNEKLQTTLNMDNKAYKVNGIINLNLHSYGNDQKDLAFNRVFNNLILQINGEIDSKNNFLNLDLASKVNNQHLIDGKLYMDNNKIYVKSDELYNKFILLGDIKNESDININLIESNDLIKLYNIVVSTIIKNIDTKNAQKEEDIVKYNGVNTNVNRYRITFNMNDFINLVKNITKDLKSNTSFTSTMDKINPTWEKEFDKSFSVPGNYQEIIQNENFLNFEYEINFYTTKDITNERLIKFNFSYKYNTEKYNTNMDIDFIDEDTYLITLSNGKIDISIKLTINNNIFNISLNTEINETKIDVSANFNYEGISTIIKEDTSNFINYRDIDNLTDEEKEIIDEKIKSNSTLIDFLHNIRDYMSPDREYAINENNNE